MVGMVEDNIDFTLVGLWYLDLRQVYEIANLIEIYKPKYILYSGFYQEGEKIGLSLQELCERYGTSPREIGLTEKVLNREKFGRRLLGAVAYTNLKGLSRDLYIHYTFIDLEYLPTYANTYEKIISTPLAAYHHAILKYIFNTILNLIQIEDIVSTIKRAINVSENFRKKLQDMRPIDYIILSAAKRVGAKIKDYDYNLDNINIVVDLVEKELKEHLGDFYDPKNLIKTVKNLIDRAIAEKLIKLNPEDLLKFEKLKVEDIYDLKNLVEIAIANSIEKYSNSPIMAIMEKSYVRDVAKILEDRGIRCKVIEPKGSIKKQELIEYVKRKYLEYLRKN